MKKYLDDILQMDIRITDNIKIKSADLLMGAFAIVLAMVARVMLFSYVSRDYDVFLSQWFNELSTYSGLGGFGASVGDYTPAYVYIMTLLTKIPLDGMISIKIVSCLFDFLASGLVLMIDYSLTKKPDKAILSAVIFLFAPTIAFNSALWAQCDVIFTFFLLASVYAFIKERSLAGAILFGVAFSFKLQAIFLAPLLFVLWLRGKMRFRDFFAIPAVYLIMIVPAFIAGRPLTELLTIYFSQSQQYKELSLNAPNLYMWFNGDRSAMVSQFGIVLTTAIVLLVAYFVVRKKLVIDKKAIVSLALLFSLLVPFLLPHMHERYFYLADVLSILYLCCYKKRWYVPATVILSSLASYVPYLFSVQAVDLKLVALAMIAIILVVVRDIFSSEPATV